MQQFTLKHSAAIDTTPDVNPLEQTVYVPPVLTTQFAHKMYSMYAFPIILTINRRYCSKQH
jgi:hypothetical protein